MEAPDALAIVRLRRAAKDVGKTCAGPTDLHQQIVGSSQRGQPSFHRLLACLDTGRCTEALGGDCTHRGKRILDAMMQLGKDQLLTNDKGSSISFEDYAIAAVDELEAPKHIRQRFTVGY